MIFADFLSFPLLGTVALSVVLLQLYLGKKYKPLDNIPGPVSPSWITGNFKQVFNPGAWAFHELIAEKYGGMARLHGPWGTKSLYIFDSKAMHTVLVKDQDVFEESDGFLESNLLIFGNGLIGTLGHQHRQQRKMLNPVFSAAHMREMIPTFFQVGHQLESALKKRLQSGPPTQEVDILSWMGRTALEIIGQAGLGYSFDPLTDDESFHPYSKAIKDLFPTLMRVQFWRMNVLQYVSRIGSASFRRFVVNLLPWEDLHHIRDMVDYMHRTAEEIYESKKRAFEMGDEVVSQQIGRGNDLISVLMRENLKASTEDRLQDSEVVGQTIIHYDISKSNRNMGSTLIFGAMDTTSSAMARLLHLLSKHPEAQDRLRQELVEAKRQKEGEDLTYNELTELPYLDAICRETLRLYAPASNVIRFARRDGVIPLHKPILGLDGTEMHEVAVPRGTTVFVSIFNANRNPDLWGKDADEWKPERWLSPLPEPLVEARIPGVYSHLMTFIGGGRSCIGFKFSQLEMSGSISVRRFLENITHSGMFTEVVISILVETFKFSPSDKDSEIFWQMNGVTAPVVGKDKHPQLPMNISLVN
ncbi:cytochrome P450 [Lentinula edodes]|nr:cytochrome P450 [Lentinula edodes]